jgi:hypothetical protein
MPERCQDDLIKMKRGFKSKLILCAIWIPLLFHNKNVFAQAQMPIPQRPKSAQRYEIDAKRIGTDINSEDALPRSREFKRIDSSYYVGWMYEGAYKYNHAADYLGFKNASVPLERALRLLERDYRRELATRTPDLLTYFPAYKFQIDYTTAAYYLMNCYSSMEETDKVYALLRRVLKWNFQRDYILDVYNYLGWTIHRSRYYTSAKYPFLKNSIDENERLANKYLDSGLRRININKALNAKIFQPGYENAEKLAVYHYKSILYSYSLNIDSAAYYYSLLRNSPIFPHNNYATFRAICGDFREAEKEYKEAVTQDAADKRLKEWAYYRSILEIYKARPEDGAELMREMIKANGSTPGFGWYNIALGRCMFYDGQTGESERYINKAAEFKELHIGTTLTQAHYDFSIQLIKLMDKQAAIERQKFEHANWWYNPNVLAEMARLLGEKYMQQFLIINQFAQNPERDRVIYKLFSTESTISWDEVWSLISDFSTRFFVDRFQKELQTDERKYVRKYFRLFVAKLEMKLGNYKHAKTELDNLLRDPDIDIEYEKLFLARVYEAEAICAAERKNSQEYNQWLYRLYTIYPQLMPNTGLKMNMSLHISGAADNAILDQLKDCNINWTNSSSTPSVPIYLVFDGKKHIQYYVLDNMGNYIVPKQVFSYQKVKNAGIELAYRLFNIGGKTPTEGTE